MDANVRCINGIERWNECQTIPLLRFCFHLLSWSKPRIAPVKWIRMFVLTGKQWRTRISPFSLSYTSTRRGHQFWGSVLKRAENYSHYSTKCIVVVGMDVHLTFSVECLVPIMARSPQADLYWSTQRAGSMDCRASLLRGVTLSLWHHSRLLHHHHTAAVKALWDRPRRPSQHWIQCAFSNSLKQCWTYKEKMAQVQEEKKG